MGLVSFLLVPFLSSALNITIIESQSGSNFGHVMDEKWKAIAMEMGHTVTMGYQITLDDIAYLDTADILIVSSGVKTLSANKVSTILQFLQSGRPVYLQSEYLASFTSNQAFAYLVAQLGGTFTWDSAFTDDIAPMRILGSFASADTAQNTIDYYWYSFSGSGDCNTVHFLERGNAYHGFHYIPANPGLGSIITCTDQDWIIYEHNPVLMKSIINHLITPQPEPLLSLGADTSICNGQSIMLDAGFSTSYLWSNGSTDSAISVATGGSYWLETTRGLCIHRDTISIAFIQLPPIDIGADVIICPNQSITLDAGQGYDIYHWSTGDSTQTIDVSTAGVYSVEATQDNCITSSNLVTVGLPELPVISNDENDLAVNTNYVYYQWYFNDEPIDGADSAYYTIEQSGVYYLVVIDGNGCTLQSNLLETSFVQSAADMDFVNSLKIYPQPAANHIMVDIAFNGASPIMLKLTDMLGQALINPIDIASSGHLQIDLGQFANGVYCLVLEREGARFTQLVVKN